MLKDLFSLALLELVRLARWKMNSMSGNNLKDLDLKIKLCTGSENKFGNMK